MIHGQLERTDLYWLSLLRKSHVLIFASKQFLFMLCQRSKFTALTHISLRNNDLFFFIKITLKVFHSTQTEKLYEYFYIIIS